MKNKSVKIWMAISGTCGILFFLIANPFVLNKLNVIIQPSVQTSINFGVAQLIINAFVFVTWTRGFLRETGFKKFVSAFGVVIPFFMATITIVKVLLPAIR